MSMGVHGKLYLFYYINEGTQETQKSNKKNKKQIK